MKYKVEVKVPEDDYDFDGWSETHGDKCKGSAKVEMVSEIHYDEDT